MAKSENGKPFLVASDEDFETRWRAWETKNRIEERAFRAKAKAILISALLLGLALSSYLLLTRSLVGR